MSRRLLSGLQAPQLHRGKLYTTSVRPSLPALPTALPDLQQPQPSGLSVLPPSHFPGPHLRHLPAPQPVHARVTGQLHGGPGGDEIECPADFAAPHHHRCA